MAAPRTLLSLTALVRRFARRRDGIAATELALIAPMLMLLFLGGAEAALLVRTHYQTAQMASTVADVVARYEMVTSADIAAIMSVSAEVMGVERFDPAGTVILSSVATDADAAATVAWQCIGGELGQASKVGAAGEAASLPDGLVLEADDNIIVAEVFYLYIPLLGWSAPATTLVYKTALFRPRLGSLTTAPGC
jgi:Flp pilus assembly protein TadG